MKKTRFCALLLLLLLAAGSSFGQISLQPGCSTPAMNANGKPDYMSGCVGNYANSPLPSVNGALTGLMLLSGGSGYTLPVVTIDPPPAVAGNRQATATATVSGGIITGLTLTDAGAGYTTVPAVTITDYTTLPTQNSPGVGGNGADAMASALVAVVPGSGIRKFVDTLPGLCLGVGPHVPNNLGQCIPVATPDTASFANNDFYRIGLVDYSRKLHRDLPTTKLRGYVELDANNTPKLATPQYLGPLILAQRNRASRVLFKNMLGTGAAGSLFLPVDTTYMGAGMAADGSSYTQNRAVIHLHGGNTPWISDGTPHQWITPAGENTPNKKGDSFQNVPDMVGAGKPNPSPSAGDGTATYYYTNAQSGRLMFYHDHSYGLTRLNVYAGEAAGYFLYDPAQESALAALGVPGTVTGSPDWAHFIPLVIQDKTFVPDTTPGGQLNLQDPTWDIGNWGGKGNLWFPHVYMPNQNPYATDNSGANPMGRWDYGPWFWPPQDPSTFVAGGKPYACPTASNPAQMCPGTPTPSGVPEGFMDTPVVNGTAYPVLHVAPAAYRFQLLNAANDRYWNLSFYQAFDAATNTVCAGTPNTPAVGSNAPSTCTEVKTVLASDGIAGQGPWADQGTAGPPIIQIGTEGGLLPSPVVIDPAPVRYEYNRRNIVVLNINSHSLFLGPAERADVVVDFTPYAGKTLILYNDSPAPVPAFDSRNDYYTGAPDQTSTGGAPTPQPGYGPNTRTIMQVVVDANSPNASPFSLANLQAPTGLPAVFALTQDPPLVPEKAYGATSNTYARIQDTSLGYGPLTGLTLVSGGTGYTQAPTVTIAAPGSGGTTATATATIDGAYLTGFTVNNPGSGYSSAPSVTLTGGGGTGATATASLASTSIGSITVTAGGSGYTTPPTVAIEGTATAVAVLGPTSVASVRMTAAGSGYTSAPTVALTGGGGTGATATAVIAASVGGIALTAGGTGYTAPPTVTFTGGGGTGASATARLAPSMLASITVTNGGNNYRSVPTVTITGGGGTGAAATATVANRRITSITVTNRGSGYTSTPTVTISGGGGSGATARANLSGTSVASIVLATAGSGYTSLPTIGFSGGGGTGAAATVTLGAVSVAGVNIVNGGSGYTSVPSVSFSGGGGAGATATATLAPAAVASISITNPGSGYLAPPAVAISGGGGTGARATAALAPAGIGAVTLTSRGSGYSSAPTVNLTGGGGSGAVVTAAILPGFVNSLTLTSPGSNYAGTPVITFSGGGGSGASATATSQSHTMLAKAIQELFTLDYGRMNATLGVELPFTNFNTQTTIPYGYVDPPTEIFKDGETQIWKITHNGVDTHAIHFHLFTVQVINRVGWDGAVRPPDPNEMSWKDTVRMSPLEDAIVALKPVKMNVPFEVPNSKRRLDVTMAAGMSSTTGFANIDPSNNPATVTDDLTNFGWEYVWHCHLLGHEENDMMRPMILAVPPAAPSGLTASATGSRVTLRWTSNSSSATATNFTVQRATSASGPWTTIATVNLPGVGNSVSYTDTSVAGRTTYYYNVMSSNLVGYVSAFAYPTVSADSAPATVSVTTP